MVSAEVSRLWHGPALELSLPAYETPSMGKEIAQTKAYYDHVAEVYDVKHGVALPGQEHNFQRHYAPFLDAALPRTGRALEIGCGTGAYTRWLVDRGLAVSAIDLSENMVRQARVRCPEAEYYLGNCEDPAAALPGPASPCFDAVVGVNCFSYLPRKEAALRRYNELLRVGGQFVIIDMNGQCPFYRVMRWMNKNEMRQWLGRIRELTERNLSLMLKRTGFEARTLTHFAFVPNGVSQGTVAVVAPVARALEAFPPVRTLAMRIACSAVKLGPAR